MAANYVLISEQTLNASASSVTFSSIPQTGYTDLVVKMSIRGSVSGDIQDNSLVTFNGSSSGYSSKLLYGTGSSAASASTSGASLNVQEYHPGGASTALTFNNGEFYIPNYTSSNYKSISSDFVTENNATAAFMGMTAGLWSNTAAITSITFTPISGDSYVAGSSFSLYGVAAVGTTPTVVPKASGGDIVVNDGTYWYHAFLSSGNFVPQTSLSANILAVAGGGGGGLSGAGFMGGGGAGGLLGFTSQALTAQPYTCVVGAGGSVNTVGADTQFGSLTLVKGGGYGGTSATNGGNGGSGGGGGELHTGGSATSGQGYGGGTGGSGPTSGGGGGGGATALGATATTGGGAGGSGSNSYSSWLSATSLGASGYVAGGGGGCADAATPGAGGAGGGGTGAKYNTTAGVAGQVNTGGGGGAGGGSAAAGAGGSGVIIIRYAM